MPHIDISTKLKNKFGVGIFFNRKMPLVPMMGLNLYFSI
jgi:hypothetical protein